MPPATTVRAFDPADLPVARALLDAELARTPYAARTRDLIDAATSDGEYRVLIAARDGVAVAVAVYGLVAGTAGAGAIHAIVVDPLHRRAGVGRALVQAATEALSRLGARFVIAEVPDDPAALAGVVDVLASSGFVETARVTDLYRDGVALAFWRRAL